MERQADGARPDHAPGCAAPQMRDAPENAVVASHEVAANVMQSRRLTADDLETGGVRVLDIERGAHFEVIEQRRAAMCQSLAIDRGPRNRYRTSGILGRQQ